MRSHPYLKKICNWILQKSFMEIVKYIFVSVVGYLYVLGFLYIFVGFLNFNESFSYFVVYLSAYVFDYILTLKLVFKKEHKSTVLIKYLIYLSLFFAFNNFLYNVALYFNIHYIASSVIVIMILFPLRFFTLKFIVLE